MLSRCVFHFSGTSTETVQHSSQKYAYYFCRYQSLLVGPNMVYHYQDANYVAMPTDNIWYARASGLVWFGTFPVRSITWTSRHF